jgi:hypothetical protein
MTLNFRISAALAMMTLTFTFFANPADAKKRDFDAVVEMCGLDADSILSSCLDKECHRVPTQSCLTHCQRLSNNRFRACMNLNVVDTSGYNGRRPNIKLPKSVRPAKQN